MLESIYIGQTGLTGFAKNLSVIGNNVANLNTVGFKGSQLLFADLFHRSQFGDTATSGGASVDLGSGLGSAGTRRVFEQGELRQTGNDQDVAISGNGFFVLRRGGEVFYTRAGQFSFDADGYLVAAGAGNARVAALAGGALRDINVRDAQTNPGKATTQVDFNGTLNNNAEATAPFTVSGVTVVDGAGRSQTLSVKFTNNKTVTAGSWLVQVNDAADQQVASGEIRFGGDGTPAAGFNRLEVRLAPDGPQAATFSLYFGEPGGIGAARSLSAAASDLKVAKTDGYAVGSLTRATFDATGQLVMTYSNGQTTRLDRLALASFSYLQGLKPVEGSLFAAGPDEAAALGHASEGPYGSLAAGQVELANVDLAQEFSDLIVTQRGYQASSQVISTANELIQQLFDLKGRR